MHNPAQMATSQSATSHLKFSSSTLLPCPPCSDPAAQSTLFRPCCLHVPATLRSRRPRSHVYACSAPSQASESSWSCCLRPSHMRSSLNAFFFVVLIFSSRAPFPNIICLCAHPAPISVHEIHQKQNTIPTRSCHILRQPVSVH